MYTNNLSKYNQGNISFILNNFHLEFLDYEEDFRDDNGEKYLGYPPKGVPQENQKYHQNFDENIELEINSEHMDQNKVTMEDRDSLGFDRKIKQKEKELTKDSPLYEKESFRQIKRDFENNRLNLNEKAHLFSAEAKKIKNGIPLKFLTSDTYGNITLNRESLTVFYS